MGLCKSHGIYLNRCRGLNLSVDGHRFKNNHPRRHEQRWNFGILLFHLYECTAPAKLTIPSNDREQSPLTQESLTPPSIPLKTVGKQPPSPALPPPPSLPPPPPPVAPVVTKLPTPASTPPAPPSQDTESRQFAIGCRHALDCKLTI